MPWRCKLCYVKYGKSEFGPALYKLLLHTKYETISQMLLYTGYIWQSMYQL